jgi:transposase
MLAWEPYVEAKALQAQGWTISAIARHLGVTRLTVRRYLNGERTPGQRARATADPFAEYVEYCRLRLGADPHLWATTLFAEVVALGYAGSYPSFTRALRGHELRPICVACRAAKTGDRALIEHPPGEETQWDYLELTDPPSQWGFAGSAFVLIGALPHSGRWRGWIAESIDQPHLIEGLDQVVRRLGGVTRRWRFDRMATVCHPDSGRLKVSFAPVAVHYQVGIDICPSRHAWRKGAVEKSAHVIAQRWWRTLADDTTVAQAQAGLDRVCARLDGRTRTRDGQRATVGALAEAEPLRPSPAPLRPCSTSSAPSPIRRWSPSAATDTPCRPGTVARSCTSTTRSARPRWTSSPAAGCRWPITCAHPTGRARSSASMSTWPR